MPTPGDAAEGNSSTPRSVDRDESPVVNEVFSMFKTYLESKLDEKTKQLESKSKLDKQVTQMKFKGNQKQFELNAQIDCVFDRIRAANDSKKSKWMIWQMKEKSSFVSGRSSSELPIRALMAGKWSTNMFRMS